MPYGIIAPSFSSLARSLYHNMLNPHGCGQLLCYLRCFQGHSAQLYFPEEIAASHNCLVVFLVKK